ncbi:MAG: S-methyl-5-thioribose-1-phosphate isomerase [Magnetococcales bacterium]|nr:S-methyl-5-thioribose-1-phosphate isomerase [Magnetococcales bacterium]
MSAQAVAWQQDKVILLDQRLLPKEQVYLQLSSAQQVADAIRDMVVRGAPAIGCTAAYGVVAEAMRLAKDGIPDSWPVAMAPGLEILLNSRPTAVNLAWAVERMRPLLMGDPSQVTQRLLQEADAIFHEDIASCKAMGRHGLDHLPADKNGKLVIMTHCNAGALATAGYGTALGVIRAAVEAGRPVHVFSTETRPYLQGARLTSWELLEDNIPVTLITDSMAGYLMSRGEIHAVVVGADRVAANGDVANKIGTYSHAVLAKRHGIPFLVACPLSTIDLATPHGDAIPIEERSADEVTHFMGQRVAATGVTVRNPAFDVTPAQLVSTLVTEKGAIANPDQEKVKALFNL